MKVMERVARRVREVAVHEQANSGSGAEQFRVAQLSPLRLEQLGGSVELEDGDPDFTIGAWVRFLLAMTWVSVGDLVWCLRERAEWQLVDVADDGTVGGELRTMLEQGLVLPTP